MRLEAGKRYILRNGEIVICDRVWDEPVAGYQASVLLPDYPHAYSLDGALLPHPLDIVAEYQEKETE
jgi:hypothetical protein